MFDSKILTDADQGVHSISDNTGTTTGTTENNAVGICTHYSTNTPEMPTVAAFDATCGVSVMPGHISHFNPDKATTQRAAENLAAYGYQVRKIDSPEKFGDIIKTGCTWSSPIYKDGHRNQINANDITTIAVEFDDVKPGIDDWETLTQNTKAFAAIPSPSFHTGYENGNKRKAPGAYRLVFRLSRPCRGGEAKAILAEVMRGFGFTDAQVDTACKDVARYWNGCKGAELLYSSQHNYDNPLDVDRILADRLNRMSSDANFTPDDIRFISGYRDGGTKLEMFGEWIYYLLYNVAPPKEWQAKLQSRHEALTPVQMALTGYEREDLAYMVRRVVRGDSEDQRESGRQVGDAAGYVAARAASGKPFQAKVVELRPSGSRNSGPVDVGQANMDIFSAVSEGLTGSALEARKIELRREYPMDSREFDRLWAANEAEHEADDSSVCDGIESLLNASQSSIELSNVLPPAIAHMLGQQAEMQNLRPELYLICLLTAVGTLAQNGTKALLHKGLGFEVTPNIYGAIVAEASQKKSPVINTVVTRPMKMLSKAAKDSYEIEHSSWELAKQAAEEAKESFDDPEPQREVFYFTNNSGEAILSQVNRCPKRGLLHLSDELAGVFKGQNQYRSGRGSDQEDMLSYYDGSGGLTIRVDGVRNDVDTLNYGILGSVQPSILERFLGDCQDSNGGWARFFFVNQPISASMLPDEFDCNDVSESLYHYYDRIAAFEPQQYRLDPPAFRYFQACVNHLDQLRVNEPNQALRAAIGKTGGRIGKIALILHLLEASANYGVMPDAFISEATVKRAAVIAQLAIDQIRAIYSNCDEEDMLSPIMAKIIQLSRRKGAIGSREVSQALSPKQRDTHKASAIRQMFVSLAGEGYGAVSGTGTKISFTAHPSRQVAIAESPSVAPISDDTVIEYNWTEEVA